MLQLLLKILLSAILLVAVSEVAKRATWAAAILASLPMTSILAMIWLYSDTHDALKVAELSRSIFWAVLPSLLFFLVLPKLLSLGVRLVPALLLSCVVMSGGYLGYGFLMARLRGS